MEDWAWVSLTWSFSNLSQCSLENCSLHPAPTKQKQKENRVKRLKRVKSKTLTGHISAMKNHGCSVFKMMDRRSRQHVLLNAFHKGVWVRCTFTDVQRGLQIICRICFSSFKLESTSAKPKGCREAFNYIRTCLPLFLKCKKKKNIIISSV